MNKAKQFVACNHDGYVIGDAILFGLAENKVSLVGRPSVMNWVQFHAETGGYKVKVERDERSAVNPTGRKLYRFQVQGPTALKVLEKATGGPLPKIKFFNMGEVTIAGRNVRALHHGMSGVTGLELFGPSQDGEEVRAAIVQPDRNSGFDSSARAYAPTPWNRMDSLSSSAIYNGEQMKAYRQWLRRIGTKGRARVGGSYYAQQHRRYYLTHTTSATGRMSNSTTTSLDEPPSRKRSTTRHGRR